MRVRAQGVRKKPSQREGGLLLALKMELRHVGSLGKLEKATRASRRNSVLSPP